MVSNNDDRWLVVQENSEKYKGISDAASSIESKLGAELSCVRIMHTYLLVVSDISLGVPKAPWSKYSFWTSCIIFCHIEIRKNKVMIETQVSKQKKDRKKETYDIFKSKCILQRR